MEQQDIKLGHSGEHADKLVDTVLAGKYQVEALIAQGAMGKVYRANQIDVDRTVAIKVMQAQMLLTPEGSERFKREAAVCAMMDHPGIVHLYGHGIADSGEPFLVMEYLEGMSLSSLLSVERLSLPRFFHLMTQVIEALKYAHGRGIAHRDLKPGNILIVGTGEQERVVLIDFGIAKALVDGPGDQKVTRTGAVLGTSTYMSPEQCAGQQPDLRTDIYSLGCVMFECLSGHPPFEGETAFDVMYKHLNQPVSEVRGLNRLPRSVSKLIARCLAKSPDERFAHMEQLEAEFRKCASSGERAASPVKYLVALAICAFLIVGVVAVFFRAKPEPPVAEETGQLPGTARRLMAHIESHDRPGRQEKLLKDSLAWLDKYDAENTAKVRSKKDVNDLGALECRVAKLCQRLNKNELALKYLERSIKHFDDPEFANRSMYAKTLGALGRTYESIAQFTRIDGAMSKLDHSSPHILSVHVDCLDGLAQVVRATGDHRRAEAIGLRARRLLEAGGLWDQQGAACAARRTLAVCAFARGDKKTGITYLKESEQLAGNYSQFEAIYAELSLIAAIYEQALLFKEASEIRAKASELALNNKRSGEAFSQFSQQCSDLFRANEGAKAIDLLNKRLAQHIERDGPDAPVTLMVRLALGAHCMHSDVKKAEEQFERILASKGNAGQAGDALKYLITLRIWQFQDPKPTLLKWEHASETPRYRANWYALLGNFEQRFDLAVSNYDKAASLCGPTDTFLLGELELRRATLMFRYNKFGAALDHYRKAERLFSDPLYPQAGVALAAGSSCLRRLGRPSEALQAAQRGVGILTAYGLQTELCDALRELAWCDPRNAQRILARCDQVIKTGLSGGEAIKQTCATEVARIELLHNSDPNKAYEAYVRLVPLLQAPQFLDLRLQCYGKLADIERGRKNLDKSRQWSEKLLSEGKQLGEVQPAIYASALMQLGVTDFDDKKFSKAREEFLRSFAYVENGPDERLKGELLFLVAVTYEEEKKFDDAKAYIAKTRAIVDNKDPLVEGKLHEALGRISGLLGDRKAEVEAYKTATLKYAQTDELRKAQTCLTTALAIARGLNMEPQLSELQKIALKH